MTYQRRPAILTTLAVTLLCALQLHAQPETPHQILQSRLGTRIDSSERRYFNFFPGTITFLSADIGDEEDALHLTVHRMREGDTTITLTAEASAALATYIDHFEEANRALYRIDWGLIHPYTIPRVPLREGKVMRVIDREGVEHVGLLAWMDTTALVLWRGGERYNWRTAGNDFDLLLPEQIVSMRLSDAGYMGLIGGTAFGTLGSTIAQSFLHDNGTRAVTSVLSFGFAVGLGELIGGSRGEREIEAIEQYRRELPHLRSQMMFDSLTAPELARILSTPRQYAESHATAGETSGGSFSSPRVRLALTNSYVMVDLGVVQEHLNMHVPTYVIQGQALFAITSAFGMGGGIWYCPTIETGNDSRHVSVITRSLLMSLTVRQPMHLRRAELFATVGIGTSLETTSLIRGSTSDIHETTVPNLSMEFGTRFQLSPPLWISLRSMASYSLPHISPAYYFYGYALSPTYVFTTLGFDFLF